MVIAVVRAVMDGGRQVPAQGAGAVPGASAAVGLAAGAAGPSAGPMGSGPPGQDHGTAAGATAQWAAYRTPATDTGGDDQQQPPEHLARLVRDEIAADRRLREGR